MKIQKPVSESGNVLFLILIAVALFAALSYAVTQSTRSGGGSAERETAILSGASMTQYPAGLRTSILRMVLGGADVSEMEFNPPSAIVGGNEGVSVFHPVGGGAIFQNAPANLMANNQPGRWSFNANFDVEDIGLSGIGGNDLTAFLPGVGLGVCRQVNEEVGISPTGCSIDAGNPAIPEIDVATEADITENMDDAYTFPVGDQPDLTNATCETYSGQPSGCFYEPDLDQFVFYSVLLER